MIRGVVFDLDHTLFDRYATLSAVAPYFCSYFDVMPDMTPEKLTPLWCQDDKAFVHLGWPKLLEEMTKQNIFRTPPAFEVFAAFLLGMFRRISVPFPETKPMLETLRKNGYKLGLITNGSSETQRAKLRNLDLENSFDQVVITGEFGEHKPSPAPFTAAARWLGAKPEELLYVGDNPLNDVEASRNAGYIPVWVRTTGTWVYPDIEKPTLQIDHIRELPALLETLR